MKITVEQLHCQRCGHEWWPRIRPDGSIVLPRNCANKKCNSPYWSTPRKSDLREFRAEIGIYGPRKQKELDDANLREIMTLMHIKPERRELFEQAEKICIERYGREITAAQIHEVIDELLTKKRNKEHEQVKVK